MARALKYRITDIETIERMAIFQMKEGNYSLPSIIIDQDFEARESYLEGYSSDEVDLSLYDRLLDEED
ncbi:MAG: hypothetical protein GTN68_44935 [Candidatus Aminicenantes bacterium]|nr:hypothetical protein [Candidatus Aminicenantes bacterium]